MVRRRYVIFFAFACIFGLSATLYIYGTAIMTALQPLTNTNPSECVKQLKFANLEIQHCKNQGNNEKRIISFALYGTLPRYLRGAISNVQLAKYIMPGWTCRFYTDGTVPAEVINELKEEGAEIVDYAGKIQGNIAGMFSRFLVADDETVDRYIVRDADARLTMRDRMAIEEWIILGKPFHIVRDHPNHKYVMNGGLWGGTKGSLKRKMIDMINEWPNKNEYLQDMTFLKEKVYPLIKENHVSHDAYHCQYFPNTRPFPTRRINKEIVGGRYDEGDVPFAEDSNLLTTVPEPCRKRVTWTLG